MSNRWIENFEKHNFRNQLNQVFSLIEELNKDDDSELAHSIELARLNKIANYIKELIGSCDPELFPFSHWDNLEESFSECLIRLKRYKENFEEDWLKQANQFLDHSLFKVIPFVKNGNEIDNASKKAFQSYSKTISEQIGQTQELLKSANDNIDETTKTIQKNLESTEESKTKIDSFEQKLFESEDALNTRVSTFFEEINDFHKKLMQGNDKEAAIKLQIQQAQEDISKEISKIRDDIKTSKGEINELDEFYSKIFGSPSEEDKNVLVGGLAQELDKRKKELDKFKLDQESKCKALIEQIEDKLPGATSAGLASAYKDLKDSFYWKIFFNTGMFYFALAALAIVSGLLVTDIHTSISATNESNGNLLMLLPISIIWKFPLALTIFWLALFSSKSRSQYQRLEQEYAHKEAVAKSYVSFKKQIDELKEDIEHKVLMKKLLGTAIDAIALNASETLDGNHEDKTPIQSLLEPIKKALGKGVSINIGGKTNLNE